MSGSKTKNYRVLFNNQTVYEGSAEQVASKFHVCRNSVMEYARKNTKLGGMFDVEALEVESDSAKAEREFIDIQVFRLIHDKNTVAMKDLEKNIILLAERGLKVKPRKVKGEKHKNMKRSDGDYYILDLVGGK